MNYYNLDGIKTELTKELAKANLFLKKWKEVTFPTKKDGTPFANMSKNISGAKYEVMRYAMQPGENELSITSWSECCGYITDTISCYKLVKNLTDTTMISKTNNYMSKVPYLEQVYKYDLDDIKIAIKNRIERLENRIISLKNQFEIVDKCFNDFQEGYNKLVADLEEKCTVIKDDSYGNNRNDIFYAIIDTVIRK